MDSYLLQLILFYCIWIVVVLFVFGVDISTVKEMITGLESLSLMAGVALLIAGSAWYCK